MSKAPDKNAAPRAIRRGRRRIALVGTAPSHSHAPYDDDSWEIWSWNRPALTMCKRWDAIFEIHNRWGYEGELEGSYLADLRATRSPRVVYSIIPLFDDPANVVLDRDDLAARYGAHWLSSSIAYAMAVAIDREPDEIGLWGIEMEAREEYVVQFSAVDHLVRLARKSGITVTMPDDCMLLRQPTPYPARFEHLLALFLENKSDVCQQLLRKIEMRLDYAIGNSRYDVEDLHELRRQIWFIKGQYHAIEMTRRMFVFNVVPPDIEDEAFIKSEAHVDG